MFTGIIEGIGRILKIENLPHSRRFWIESPFSLKNEKLGASIAVEGCCLTVTQKTARRFAADVSPETLKRTTLGSFKTGKGVNLERPVSLSTRLGGHLVQGHVDGVGTIQSKKRVKSGKEVYEVVQIQLPVGLKKYLVEKGSVAIDGISLTVNSVGKTSFTVCLIPHTQALTTLTAKKPGDRVNLEVDILAKYLEQLMKR
ncbi:MAG: riboflavin synthase [bacterium]